MEQLNGRGRRWWSVRLVPVIVVVAAIAGVVTWRSLGADAPACERATPAGHSVARVWDEVAMAAIRRDFPAPTVHARNLFHLSAAMWDAWALYHSPASPWLPASRAIEVTAPASDTDADAAAEAAMSLAAATVLRHRYANAIGSAATLVDVDSALEDLCLTTLVGAPDRSPESVGRLVGDGYVAFGATDGAREETAYIDPGYEPSNPPLVVARSGAEPADPSRWQPLKMDVLIAQNGLAEQSDTQSYVGSHWGHVTPFALPATPDGVPLDPAPVPRLSDADGGAAYRAGAVAVLRASSRLDPSDGVTIDVSPASRGDNPLATDDGRGYASNPVTGDPYDAQQVLVGDYERSIAEYWADGPNSETPPGHWHVLANEVSDELFASSSRLRIAGAGEPAGRLEWDTKLYFALSAANHDAAIAAWGLKTHYDSARPITMIRHLGGLGQSSDPARPGYHPDGLPLVDGLVDVVTDANSAPGQPLEEFAGQTGAVVVRAWRGQPLDIRNDAGGVGWIRAVDWVPYQKPTFVSPAFPGYVSGHSAYSRASAEVLAAFTASPYFPHGRHCVERGPGSLHFEAGPTAPLELCWASYVDAADEAGRSRIAGGIHVPADDYAGRRVGHQVGLGAWDEAVAYFDGRAQ